MRTWVGSIVNRKQYEKNRELVKLEIVGSWSVQGSRTALCLRSLHQLLSLSKDLNLARKSCWFGLGFQKIKTAPHIVSASVGASEIGSTNGLR
ncbi:hypothetical protein F2Q69_00048493 [Brassica cretica]|uniref:Uncharacterized protein n=1 Tax=Brassica cretica TaxID=69181 RepID=A0A8S9Q0J4_BRACR|nr:hypothetical protein F2Q69_00048493 [Brassica cretica]